MSSTGIMRGEEEDDDDDIRENVECDVWMARLKLLLWIVLSIIVAMG